VSSRALVQASVAAAAVLVVVSLALGGASYEPRQVADPCQPRQLRQPHGVQELAQQLTLSALDGAACELHTSRETLALALASPAGRRRFASNPRLGSALRAGLVRAIDDAGRAGELPGPVADGLSAIAARLPADQIVAAIRNAGGLLNQAGGFLGPLAQALGALSGR
jgi:hypothetical protein